jgi:hypothetical protein
MTAFKILAGLVLTLALAAAFGSPASAQQYTVSSITTTNLGNIASAPVGSSTFQTAPSTGTVTRTSGSAVRLTTGSARSLVTVGCVGAIVCPATTVLVAISQTGTPTRRAGALQNFTASLTSGSFLTAPGSGNSISFTFVGIPDGGSRTFYVGFDFPFTGDNGGASSGTSTANFAVSATTLLGTQGGSLAGLATANVFRSIAITNSTALAFGRITRPRTGSGTVSLAAATGTVTTTGTGVTKMPSPASTAASFTATGEGGQSFSVSTPSTFNLTNGANTITVTLTPSVSGNQTFSGTIGSAGTLPILVGGNFGLTSTTALGTYTGSFGVTVTYN